ncbi:MAG: TolC family protein [Bacteroidota bacterium]
MFDRILIFLICLCMSLPAAFGQESNLWDLRRCLDYAAQNNLQLKRNVLNLRSSEIDLAQAREGQLPSLNGSAGFTENLGFSIDPVTNQFATNGTESANLGITANVPIYQGGRLRRQVLYYYQCWLLWR